MTLRLSEVYKSVQGEGPRVGEPTVFVRFAGCNLRCPGWPCDTPHAIDPEKFRTEWRNLVVEDVVDEIVAATSSTSNICFTGGEPFLQQEEELHKLVDALVLEGFTVFEAFTNGTLPIPEWVNEHVYLVMDWKLDGSGEGDSPDVRAKNVMCMDSQDAIKFTIKNAEDFEQAYDLWHALSIRFEQARRKGWERPQFFYGPVWGALEPEELVSWAMDRGLPWRLNLQMHNYIWDRTQRGI